MKYVDLRPGQENEIPPECPMCGAGIKRTRWEAGTVYYTSYSPEQAAAYGLGPGDVATTVLWAWRCSVDEAHCGGPVLLG